MRFFVCILHLGIFTINSGASNVGSISTPTTETITIPEMTTNIMLKYGSKFKTPFPNTELEGLRCFEAKSPVIKTLHEVFFYWDQERDIFTKYVAFLARNILRIPETLTYSPAALKIMLVNMIMSQLGEFYSKPQERRIPAIELIKYLMKTERKKDKAVSDELNKSFLNAVKSVPDTNREAFMALSELLPRVELLRVFNCPDNVIKEILDNFAKISRRYESRTYADVLFAIEDIGLLYFWDSVKDNMNADFDGQDLANDLMEYVAFKENTSEPAFIKRNFLR